MCILPCPVPVVEGMLQGMGAGVSGAAPGTGAAGLCHPCLFHSGNLDPTYLITLLEGECSVRPVVECTGNSCIRLGRANLMALIAWE